MLSGALGLTKWSFTYNNPIFPASLIENIILSLMIVLTSFLEFFGLYIGDSIAKLSLCFQ
jgi:hypothetical protein